MIIFSFNVYIYIFHRGKQLNIIRSAEMGNEQKTNKNNKNAFQ